MKDDERKRIAESIRAARLAAGLTQVDVSKAAAISQPAISAIESGESQPSIQSLIRLADAYRVSLDDLVGRTGGNDTATRLAKGRQKKQPSATGVRRPGTTTNE